jgi:hypothetical protein
MNSYRFNPIPDESDSLPPARRRREKRLLTTFDAEEREKILDELAHQLSPSFDFFVFSLLSGIIFSLGLLLNSPALLVLGAIAAPLMTPIIGIALGIVIGSARFFIRSLAGLLVSSLLVIITGALAGWLSRLNASHLLTEAQTHARFTWDTFLVLVIGVILTAWMIIRAEHNPRIPSVVLAYGLYLPLAVAGVGLTSRFPHFWPDGSGFGKRHRGFSAGYSGFPPFNIIWLHSGRRHGPIGYHPVDRAQRHRGSLHGSDWHTNLYTYSDQYPDFNPNGDSDAHSSHLDPYLNNDPHAHVHRNGHTHSFTYTIPCTG